MLKGMLRVRPATLDDCADIARIYNQGIAGRQATFETHPRAPDDVAKWFDGHPIVVVESEGAVVGFAATSTYRPRECYRGVAEFSVYVDAAKRRAGAGRAAMLALMKEAKSRGYWKLLSRVFPENIASLGLLESLGFRQIGIYKRHGQLEGVWKDTVIVEKLLDE